MGMFDFLKRKQKAWHHVIEVTDDDFEVQVLQRSYKQPLMVDFWAAWCQPCRQLSPVIERIATEADSPVHLAKLETSENPDWAGKMGIQSIPHVKMFWNGMMIGEFRGLQFENNIRKWIGEKMDGGAPKPKIRVPRKQEDRVTKAKTLLKKGNGFEATLNLRDLEMAEARTLLPLAEWLWDVSDGDALTGDVSADSLALDVLNCMETGDLATAKSTLATLRQSTSIPLDDVASGLGHLTT